MQVEEQEIKRKGENKMTNTVENLSVNQRIFKELWVVDYMKAYEFAKENGLSDDDMKTVLHELNKEMGK